MRFPARLDDSAFAALDCALYLRNNLRDWRWAGWGNEPPPVGNLQRPPVKLFTTPNQKEAQLTYQLHLKICTNKTTSSFQPFPTQTTQNINLNLTPPEAPRQSFGIAPSSPINERRCTERVPVKEGGALYRSERGDGQDLRAWFSVQPSVV